jgi:hypothetical protein
MALASHASIVMARFDEMRTTADLPPLDSAGTLFRRVAADTRGAATEPASQRAFRFLMLGLHADEASANELVDRGLAAAPSFAQAAEVWMAVVRPFRHFGECNYLDRATPGPLFGTVEAPPPLTDPIAVITTAGWTLGETLDMTRVREFSNGVGAVRISMTGADGLYSQESFFFPGGLQHDAITVTLWRDAAAARAFAYGAGVHKMMLGRQREENLADRTSFTRCRIVRASGTWHGRNPLPSP